MSLTLKLRSVLSLAATVAISAVLVTSAVAQDGPFSNASLHGTYAVWFFSSPPDGPMINHGVFIMHSYDGEGNAHLLSVYRNRAGELDENGLITRDIDRFVDDPESWGNTDGHTYNVQPFGAWTWTNRGGTVFDGIFIETEMIDGVLTAVEFMLVSPGASSRNGGAMSVWHGARIADGDILPPVPPAD